MAGGLTPAGIQYVVQGFSQGLQQLSQLDKAQQTLGKSGSQLGGQFAGLGKSALGAGAILGGAALAGVTALAGGLVYLGTQALDSYAKYERMSLSIQNLVARELSQGKEQLVQKQELARLTKEETAEIADLQQKITDEQLDRDSLAASIQEQRQRVIELTASYGENGLNVQTAKAKLAEMENELGKSDAATAKMTARIEELNAKNGQLVTVTEKVRTGQMSMKDAMEQAGPKAKELLDWISKLAIASPFDQAGIALAFKTAATYGFTADQAKRLTEAEVDFAAATGASIDVTNQIALALGQMQAKGKVSGQELIQLTNAGIGTNAILEKMGFTVDDVSKGLVDSDKFIEAVVADMEIFKGAAKAQASTFSGLLTSLEELKSVGLREFFTGTFQAIQPYLASFVDLVTQPATFEMFRAWGDVLGGAVSRGMQNFIALVKQLQSAFAKGGAGGIFAALGITPDAMVLFNLIGKSITDLAAVVTSQLTPAMQGFQGIIPTLNSLITFLVQNFESVKGAIIGIGAVIGVGVFAALIAGLASLLTPMTAIIAGVALLGAAWQGNWYNIQGVTQQVITFMQNIISVFVSAITTYMGPQLQTAFDNITAALGKLGYDWGDVWNAIVEATKIVAIAIGVVVLGIITVFTSMVTGVASALTTLTTYIDQFAAGFKMVIEGVATVFVGVTNLVKAIIAGDWTAAWQSFVMIGSGAIQTIVGLGSLISTSLEAGFAAAVSFISQFALSVITIFQGLYDTLVGNSIIPDLVNQVIMLFTGMAQPVIDVFNKIGSTISGILANIFSGITDTPLDLTTLTTILPQAILNNVNLLNSMFTTMSGINNLFMLGWPASLKVMRSVANEVLTELETQLGNIERNVGSITMAVNAMSAAFRAMSSGVAQSLGTLNSKLAETSAKFRELRDAANQAAAASAHVADTASEYSKLLNMIEKITTAFEKMKDAAIEAGDASSGAAASGSAKTGVGLARGIGFAAGSPNGGGILGLGYQIPIGYPNDSFGPLFVQSGEQMLVTPRNTSIDEVVFNRIREIGLPMYGGGAPQINVTVGSINNGMDLAMLQNIIERTVVQSMA